MGGPATDDMKAAFGAALAVAMQEAGVGIPELAQQVAVSDDAVRTWVGGRNVPQPLTVFALEELLGTARGELSHHLGYIPVGAPVSVPAAIRDDELLSEDIKAALLATYRVGRRRG